VYFGCSPSLSHHPQMGPSSCRKTSSGLPLNLHYGELYNCFIIHYKVVIIELKCSTNVMGLNHPQTIIPHRCGKTIFQRLVLVAKKVEDCCPTPFLMTTLLPYFQLPWGQPSAHFLSPSYRKHAYACTYTNSCTLKIEMTATCILAFGYNETIILTFYTLLIIYNKLKKYLNCHL
jgi:hypothetical protein